MGQTLRKRFLPCIIFSCTTALLPAFAKAQAPASAVRSQSIDLYAAGAYSQTDYGSNDKGFLIGGDFTYHFHLADVALDLRYNHVTGDTVGEKTFEGGLKLARGYGRYHPYVHALIGYGIVTFDHPITNPDGSLYSYDDSTVYDIGGGVDVTLTRNFALKADLQYQYWNLGARGMTKPVTLNPALESIGIVYRIPYRFLRPRRY